MIIIHGDDHLTAISNEDYNKISAEDKEKLLSSCNIYLSDEITAPTTQEEAQHIISISTRITIDSII